MNREQVQSLLKTLRMRYPEYYAGKSKEEIIDIFNSFCIVLADANQISIAGALKSYMGSTESAYPPTAQQLFAKAKKMPPEMWEQIMSENQSGNVKLLESNVEKRHGTRREILLDCAALIASYDVDTKEQLQTWWNTYADPDNPLTETEVQTIWRKD
jgi:hypothetical protein|nr:MAG TPA: replisome organizer [Caudoviricetes sp.]